ncbi:MAG: hypothetical protein J0I06_24865 [Planctomycetes bacterium]|nr:hypothetical protein [Planctomycetota bacterium]
MMRQVIRGLVLFGVLTAVVGSAVQAQTVPDQVTVRDRKDGSTKTYSGVFTLGPAGFQVLGTDKKVVATVNPDDVVKVAIGELPGVERTVILSLNAKEEKKDYAGAQAGYKDLLAKAAGAPERSKRYLQYKTLVNYNRVVDELDPDKGWKEKAEDVAKAWRGYLGDYPSGWEVWPAVRSYTRVQVELGKFDEAARAWEKLAANKELPPDAKVEAQLQQIDLNIRGKVYSNAALAAAELLKTATGARKERLIIYELAAKANGDPKQSLDAVEKIKAEMDKTKDASVHATGFSMMGEMYLVGGKARDAMWSFLWVETVLNQDRDEAFKAVSRLAVMFETNKDVADEDQARKYHEKLKRVRTSF